MQRTLRECKVARCYELTREEHGYCKEHEYIWEEEEKKRKERLFSKDPKCTSSIYNRFYWSRKWKDKRVSILNRDNYLCLNCKIKAATEVHHIELVTEAWNKRLTSSNLICLCNECHDEVHREYNKGLIQKKKEQERLRELIKTRNDI